MALQRVSISEQLTFSLSIHLIVVKTCDLYVDSSFIPNRPKWDAIQKSRKSHEQLIYPTMLILSERSQIQNVTSCFISFR